MKNLISKKLALEHAAICRLSSNGESLRTEREIKQDERELLDSIQNELTYASVRHKDASCTIGQTIYSITLTTSDGHVTNIDVRHNAMYDATGKLRLLGVVNSSLVHFLDKILSKSETVVVNHAQELLQALG